jgi:PASTA domain-containing protein
MPTDVKLDAGDGSFVLVQGRVLKVAGSDLVLDAPERRKENKTPNRRALVHDFQDGLTINFNGDYPGGVTIAGNAAVTGDLLLAGTALRTTLESIQFSVQSLQGTIGGMSGLVALIGASVVPAWRTKTQVEQGSDEEALGGGPEIQSTNDLGLTITFDFDRHHPGFAHEDVISISPPPGTAVKPGSTVVVTVNLEG